MDELCTNYGTRLELYTSDDKNGFNYTEYGDTLSLVLDSNLAIESSIYYLIYDTLNMIVKNIHLLL